MVRSPHPATLAQHATRRRMFRRQDSAARAALTRTYRI
jgi:hypothetical protein